MSINESVSVRIDWLAYTSNEVKFPENLTNVYDIAVPFRGYNRARKFSDGRVQSQSNRKTMPDHVQYSGSTLERLSGQITGLELIKYHLEQGVKFTRLDVAIDAMNTGLDICKLYDDFNKGYCETNSRKSSLIRSNTGMTMYIGSRSSEGFMRVYDKAGERGIEGDWKRIEMEYKGSKANKVAGLLIKNSRTSEVITGLVRGHADFNQDDNWVRILGAEKQIVVTDKNTDKDTVAWLRQVAKSLAKQAIDNPDFITEFYGIMAREMEAIQDKRNTERW